jgi:glutamate--cysteine ligase catalytic subunit
LENDWSKSKNGRNLTKEDDIKELFIWQILEGDASVGFPKGMISLFEEFMKKHQWSESDSNETMEYMNFLLNRAKGKLPTAASYIREFVTSHQDYK